MKVLPYGCQQGLHCPSPPTWRISMFHCGKRGLHLILFPPGRVPNRSPRRLGLVDHGASRDISKKSPAISVMSRQSFAYDRSRQTGGLATVRRGTWRIAFNPGLPANQTAQHLSLAFQMPGNQGPGSFSRSQMSKVKHPVCPIRHAGRWRIRCTTGRLDSDARETSVAASKKAVVWSRLASSSISDFRFDAPVGEDASCLACIITMRSACFPNLARISSVAVRRVRTSIAVLLGSASLRAAGLVVEVGSRQCRYADIRRRRPTFQSFLRDSNDRRP